MNALPGRSDLNDKAPDTCPVALLLIDVITDFSFAGGDKLMKETLVAARRHFAPLLEKARRAGVPVIYVNDNNGKWQSDFKGQVRDCLAGPSKAATIVKLLEPSPADYNVLKLQHSGFYASPLHELLQSFRARRLIITGMLAESCVLFTAADAYFR